MLHTLPACFEDCPPTIVARVLQNFGTDKSRHTYTEKGCDTQEDQRHSDPIFDIFDANLWVYVRKPQEGVSLFVHMTLRSPDIPQNSLSCRNFLAPVHPLLMALLIPFRKI